MLLVVLAALVAWVLVAAGVGTVVGRALGSAGIGDSSPAPAASTLSASSALAATDR